MLTLGIETTCDETAAALVRSGKGIDSHVIFSQAPVHNEFGGVVPEIASRQHIETIIPVLKECLAKAAISLTDIDLIAVASEPGLIGALLVGIQTAKALAWSLNKPLIGVNHVEAHLYASMMGQNSLPLPALGVVLSGGHSTLLHIEDVGKYTLIGQTVDDAMGEAFDKVSKTLSLGYPGGPAVEKKALLGDPKAFDFRAGRVKKDPYAFSFSGLKTAVLYTVEKLTLSEQIICDICASFQRAAFTDLIKKITKASEEFDTKAIFLGGGVTQNSTLRSMLQKSTPLPIFWPPQQLCLDNAAMIAGLGYHKWQESPVDMRFTLEPKTRTPLF